MPSPTRPNSGGSLRRMGTEGHAGLIEAIQRFLDDAVGAPQRILEEMMRTGEGLPLSLQEWAQPLADLPTCVEVNALARRVSLAAGYLLPEPAGRPLDADALLARLDDAERDVIEIAKQGGAKLRLVAFPTAAATVVPLDKSVTPEFAQIIAELIKTITCYYPGCAG